MNHDPWQEFMDKLRRHNSPPETNWERWRRRFPKLQLDHIPGDNLTVLMAGNPNPELSLEYYNSVWTNISKNNAMEAARQLVQFFKRHRFTFWYSGWVQIAVARIVLEDANAAKEFVNSFWREAKRRPAESRTAALDALSLVEGEHRKHWLNATAWMKHFYDRKHVPREAEWRFVNRAVKEYRQAVRQHSCLKDEGLKAIAISVFEDPAARLNELTDRALARLYRTSPSTLAHVRAEVGASGLRGGQLRRPRLGQSGKATS